LKSAQKRREFPHALKLTSIVASILASITTWETASMDLAATFRIPSKDRSQGQSPPKILAKSFITKTIAH